MPKPRRPIAPSSAELPPTAHPEALEGRATLPAASIFHPDEYIDGPRVRLSRLDSTALPSMAPWLEAALAPDWPLEALASAVEAGGGALITDTAGEPIGIAIALLGAPSSDAAMVPVLAIDPARRFRGLGGEAGLALETHLRARFGVSRVYAPIPDGRGLAVYFWLRLGYRPLRQSEAPGPVLGLTGEQRRGIWMLRDGD